MTCVSFGIYVCMPKWLSASTSKKHTSRNSSRLRQHKDREQEKNKPVPSPVQTGCKQMWQWTACRCKPHPDRTPCLLSWYRMGCSCLSKGKRPQKSQTDLSVVSRVSSRGHPLCIVISYRIPLSLSLLFIFFLKIIFAYCSFAFLDPCAFVWPDDICLKYKITPPSTRLFCAADCASSSVRLNAPGVFKHGPWWSSLTVISSPGHRVGSTPTSLVWGRFKGLRWSFTLVFGRSFDQLFVLFFGC